MCVCVVVSWEQIGCRWSQCIPVSVGKGVNSGDLTLEKNRRWFFPSVVGVAVEMEVVRLKYPIIGIPENLTTVLVSVHFFRSWP